MNRKVLVSLLGAAALAAAACGSTTSPASAPSGGATTSPGSSGAKPVGPPLIEEATTGVTFSDDFNPYDANSLARGMNMRSLIWEPLYEMDALDPNQNNPWLATGYSFSNGGESLAITLRAGVRFNDGSAMTPADVAATFKLMMTTSAANLPGVPPQAAAPTVSGDTVTLSFKSPAFTALWNILGSTYVLPAAIAQEIAANPTVTISHDKAVGSGPFVPTSYSTSVVKFTPNKNYWGGTPPESEVDVPSIQSNTTVVTDLTANPPQLDWAGNDIPNIYSDYVDLNPETNHAWFASGNTVVLWFNLNAGNGGATGIGDPKVRKA
ncbi:MAG TPA: ABC transporter substrate-binding protein, partial [Candidatus Binatia bacterium]|nr:ABC transporter substrate-binding protein [Candidatus Binatia bacterium]